MTYDEWEVQAGRVLAAFPGHDFPAETAAVYFDHLKDFAVEEVRAACHQAINTCTFFPRIAELRSFVDENRMAAVERNRTRPKLPEPEANADPSLMRRVVEMCKRVGRPFPD